VINVQKAILKMALRKELISINEFSIALEKLEKREKKPNIACYSDEIR
jgi:hypothetical protein